ncbi:hypothetical protein [Microbacterium sp. NPDC057650]|uniref:hypothetical protein n=1 Tax=unclassified Microbacterium TaxID=2609290 RepID=UPI00366E2578
MKRQAIGALSALILVGGSVLGGVQASSGVGSPAAAASQASCLQYGEDGLPVFSGQASDELNAADVLISQLDEKYPETVLGSSFCSDYSGLVLFTTGTDKAIDKAVRGAKKLLAKGEEIYVQKSTISLATAQKTISQLSSTVSEDTGVTAFAPDIFNSGVYVQVASKAAESKLRADKDLGVEARKASGEASIPIRTVVSSDRPQTATTRWDDVAPWNMSTAITSAGMRCSLGVPVTINGSRMAVTAGHCPGTSFVHPGNGASAGTMHTTTWSANADIYGDWKLLRSSTYANRVFSGSLSSSSWLPISGINWGTRSAGSQLCTSGSTTGQICRYFVRLTNVTANINDGTQVVTTGHLTLMRHDSNAGSAYDTNGFRGGDSGGPCYYADGNGGVTVAGTVSAYGGTSYFCSQFTGLKKWAPGAHF